MTEVPLTDEQFAKLFGFCVLRPSKEALERAREVNALFDALAEEAGVQSYEAFVRVGKQEEHLRFLSCVSSCPSEVITAAQRMLAPGSPERAAELKRKEERAERLNKKSK